MRWLRSIAREFAGLFVDDGSLAAALLAWIVAGTLALRMLHGAHFGGPIFAGGLVVVFVENVLRFSRPPRSANAGDGDDSATRHPD